MGVEFKTKLDPKKLMVDRIARLERAMGRLLEEEIGEIIKRTQGGKDVELKGFSRYSKAYAKKREKSGRSSNVDLTYSGQLLQSLTSKVKRIGQVVEGVIYFLAGRQNRSKSNATNLDIARGLLRERKFFGLDRNQVKRITEKLKNA